MRNSVAISHRRAARGPVGAGTHFDWLAQASYFARIAHSTSEKEGIGSFGEPRSAGGDCCCITGLPRLGRCDLSCYKKVIEAADIRAMDCHLQIAGMGSVTSSAGKCYINSISPPLQTYQPLSHGCQFRSLKEVLISSSPSHLLIGEMTRFIQSEYHHAILQDD
jgi:hypothetical protein